MCVDYEHAFRFLYEEVFFVLSDMGAYVRDQMLERLCSESSVVANPWGIEEDCNVIVVQKQM